jgi:hypothetical protein
MTTIEFESRTCAICNTSKAQLILYSTNSFGSPDLDLRPPEMQRSTMSTWVQKCSECGYCSTDISETTSHALETIESDAYRLIRDHKVFPDLAKSFLMLALLQEPTDQRVATQSRIHAAWVCDDSGDNALASECRILAVRDMESTMPFDNTDDGLWDGVIYTDLLRRTQRFDDAIAAVNALLTYSEANEMIRQMLQYERQLCKERIVECRSMVDAECIQLD